MNIKKQKGLVLVTGLIFLLIAMLASISTLENAGILAYEQGNNIDHYRLFYQLESQLLLIEKPLIESEFSIKSLDKILEGKHIKNSSKLEEIVFLNDIWNANNAYLQENKDYLFLIEYLGTKALTTNEENISEASINSWLFRISVSSLHKQFYWLQSIVEVYPIETIELLKAEKGTENNSGDMQEYASRRIAWYERVANE